MRDHLVMMPLAALKPTTATATDVGIPATAPALTADLPAAQAPATTAANGTAIATTQGAAPIEKSPTNGLPTILMIGGIFLVMYLFMFRGQRKTEKSRKLLLSSMKKGDKVMTIGGLVARVVSIDDEDVVLKIDESANVKAVYKKTSIQQVLDRDEKAK